MFTFEIGQAYTLEELPEDLREIFAACYHQGQCDDDVETAAKHFAVDDADGLRDYLGEFGAWDAEELADDEANLGRLLWTMAANIHDDGVAYIGM